MEIVYTDKALKDLSFWSKIGDKVIQQKITNLILSIENTPFVGIGKREALKYHLSGKWSRRIDRENRIVYELLEELVIIHSLKGHY